MNTPTEYPQVLVDTPAATVVRVSEAQLVACCVDDAPESRGSRELPDPQELMIGTGLNFGPFTLEDIGDMGLEWYKSVATKEDE